MGLTVTTQHQESLWQRREASLPDTWCVEGWRVKLALCTESSSAMLFLLKKILVKQNLKGNIQSPRGWHFQPIMYLFLAFLCISAGDLKL